MAEDVNEIENDSHELEAVEADVPAHEMRVESDADTGDAPNSGNEPLAMDAALSEISSLADLIDDSRIDDTDDEDAVFEWTPDIDQEFVEENSPVPTIESVIEAILFTSDEPVTSLRIAKIADLSSTKQVSDAIKVLNDRYEQSNSAFRIEKIAGGYQMLTHKIYNNWLRRLIRVRTETKLTQASLETLAIIAYKQPIIRADIEAIRGVASGEMIRGLMSKGLVKIAGRAEVLGRPMQYGTTRKFLETFGLNSIKDLPKADELKKPHD